MNNRQARPKLLPGGQVAGAVVPDLKFFRDALKHRVKCRSVQVAQLLEVVDDGVGPDLLQLLQREHLCAKDDVANTGLEAVLADRDLMTQRLQPHWTVSMISR